MIEVVHYKNRHGKGLVGVFGVSRSYKVPEQVQYDQRYAAGLEPAFYPVPAIQGYNEQFAVCYFIELLKGMLCHV